MKVFNTILCILACAFLVLALLVLWSWALSPTAEAAGVWTDRQTAAHEIAEKARALGLEETNPIITEAQRLWAEEEAGKPTDRGIAYTDEDVRILANVIYFEAWGGCTDRHRELVAAVVVNRVRDPRFPDTVAGVVGQPGQYSKGYINYKYNCPDSAWATCSAIAVRALRGRVDCPENVIYQANFRQGTGTYETCRTSYSTTWFCYG